MPSQPVLYLLSGLPGSGKTTHARSLETVGVERVSVDEQLIAAHGRLGVDYPAAEHMARLGSVVDTAHGQVRDLLRSGSDVVFDHGLGLRVERDAMKRLATDAGATWELLYFDADIHALRARCAFRDLHVDAVPISNAVLTDMARDREPPDNEGEKRIDTNCAIPDFYSTTDRWWGPATSAVDIVDTLRANLCADLVPAGGRVLELGCGNGTTAQATAALGFQVTGIDFSERIDRSDGAPVTFFKDDFMTHTFAQRFDSVTYWDGFGLGTNADHVALFNRIADELLAPDGVVIFEVYDPTGFINDDGLAERLPARPDAGYHYSLEHRRLFDRTSQQAIDAWQEVGSTQVWHQTLQCYTPASFAELAATTRLTVDQTLDDMRSDWSYLAVLRPQP